MASLETAYSTVGKLTKLKEFHQNKCTTLDRQIDQLVYELYGLSEEEIRIVEGG